jgi:hypothetical protein
MTSSPDAVDRAERQARIEEDIRRLFARYRRQTEPSPQPERRFARARTPQSTSTPPPPPRRA